MKAGDILYCIKTRVDYNSDNLPKIPHIKNKFYRIHTIVEPFFLNRVQEEPKHREGDPECFIYVESEPNTTPGNYFGYAYPETVKDLILESFTDHFITLVESRKIKLKRIQTGQTI